MSFFKRKKRTKKKRHNGESGWASFFEIVFDVLDIFS